MIHFGWLTPLPLLLASLTATPAFADAVAAPIAVSPVAKAQQSLVDAAAALSAAPAPAPTIPDLTARLNVIKAAVASADTALGVPPPTIPPAFWSTPAGIGLSIAFSVATIGLSAGATYATIAASK